MRHGVRSSHPARSRIRPVRRHANPGHSLAIGSTIGITCYCIREKLALRSARFDLCSQRPGFRKVPGLFHCRIQLASALALSRDLWSATSITVHCFKARCETNSEPADDRTMFLIRHPLHFGCVLSLRGRMKWCWRPGMCATHGLGLVQRDTTSDGMFALGHSRSGLDADSATN
jgi:hypothetical protein